MAKFVTLILFLIFRDVKPTKKQDYDTMIEVVKDIVMKFDLRCVTMFHSKQDEGVGSRISRGLIKVLRFQSLVEINFQCYDQFSKNSCPVSLNIINGLDLATREEFLEVMRVCLLGCC